MLRHTRRFAAIRRHCRRLYFDAITPMAFAFFAFRPSHYAAAHDMPSATLMMMLRRDTLHTHV